MTDDQLNAEEDRLFRLFHPMPNNNKRESLFRKWLKIREEQSRRLYGS